MTNIRVRPSLLLAAIFFASCLNSSAQPAGKSGGAKQTTTKQAAKGTATAVPVAEEDPMFSPPRNERQPAVPQSIPAFNDMIQELQSLNAAVDNDDASAFDTAAKGSRFLNLALTGDSPTTLEMIAMKCKTQCLEFFTLARREGARLNALGLDGTTPRHWAVFVNNQAALDALNQLKVASVPDVYGFTAEYYARREDGYAFYKQCHEVRFALVKIHRNWKDNAARTNIANVMMGIWQNPTGRKLTPLENALVEEGHVQDAANVMNLSRDAAEMAGSNAGRLCGRIKQMIRRAGFGPFDKFRCSDQPE